MVAVPGRLDVHRLGLAALPGAHALQGELDLVSADVGIGAVDPGLIAADLHLARAQVGEVEGVGLAVVHVGGEALDFGLLHGVGVRVALGVELVQVGVAVMIVRPDRRDVQRLGLTAFLGTGALQGQGDLVRADVGVLAVQPGLIAADLHLAHAGVGEIECIEGTVVHGGVEALDGRLLHGVGVRVALSVELVQVRETVAVAVPGGFDVQRLRRAAFLGAHALQGQGDFIRADVGVFAVQPGLIAADLHLAHAQVGEVDGVEGAVVHVGGEALDGLLFHGVGVRVALAVELIQIRVAVAVAGPDGLHVQRFGLAARLRAGALQGQGDFVLADVGFPAVQPGLFAADLHLAHAQVGDVLGVALHIIAGGKAGDVGLGHGVGVLPAQVVVLVQIGIGIGVARPGGAGVHGFLAAARGRALEGQGDLVHADVGIPAVQPGLGTGNAHLGLFIGDGEHQRALVRAGGHGDPAALRIQPVGGDFAEAVQHKVQIRGYDEAVGGLRLPNGIALVVRQSGQGVVAAVGGPAVKGLSVGVQQRHLRAAHGISAGRQLPHLQHDGRVFNGHAGQAAIRAHHVQRRAVRVQGLHDHAAGFIHVERHHRAALVARGGEGLGEGIGLADDQPADRMDVCVAGPGIDHLSPAVLQLQRRAGDARAVGIHLGKAHLHGRIAHLHHQALVVRGGGHGVAVRLDAAVRQHPEALVRHGQIAHGGLRLLQHVFAAAVQVVDRVVLRSGADPALAHRRRAVGLVQRQRRAGQRRAGLVHLAEVERILDIPVIVHRLLVVRVAVVDDTRDDHLPLQVVPDRHLHRVDAFVIQQVPLQGVRVTVLRGHDLADPVFIDALFGIPDGAELRGAVFVVRGGGPPRLGGHGRAACILCLQFELEAHVRPVLRVLHPGFQDRRPVLAQDLLPDAQGQVHGGGLVVVDDGRVPAAGAVGHRRLHQVGQLVQRHGHVHRDGGGIVVHAVQLPDQLGARLLPGRGIRILHVQRLTGGAEAHGVRGDILPQGVLHGLGMVHVDVRAVDLLRVRQLQIQAQPTVFHLFGVQGQRVIDHAAPGVVQREGVHAVVGGGAVDPLGDGQRERRQLRLLFIGIDKGRRRAGPAPVLFRIGVGREVFHFGADGAVPVVDQPDPHGAGRQVVVDLVAHIAHDPVAVHDRPGVVGHDLRQHVGEGLARGVGAVRLPEIRPFIGDVHAAGLLRRFRVAAALDRNLVRLRAVHDGQGRVLQVVDPEAIGLLRGAQPGPAIDPLCDGQPGGGALRGEAVVEGLRVRLDLAVRRGLQALQGLVVGHLHLDGMLRAVVDQAVHPPGQDHAGQPVGLQLLRGNDLPVLRVGEVHLARALQRLGHAHLLAGGVEAHRAVGDALPQGIGVRVAHVLLGVAAGDRAGEVVLVQRQGLEHRFGAVLVPADQLEGEGIAVLPLPVDQVLRHGDGDLGLLLIAVHEGIVRRLDRHQRLLVVEGEGLGVQVQGAVAIVHHGGLHDEGGAVVLHVLNPVGLGLGDHLGDPVIIHLADVPGLHVDGAEGDVAVLVVRRRARLGHGRLARRAGCEDLPGLDVEAVDGKRELAGLQRSAARKHLAGIDVHLAAGDVVHILHAEGHDVIGAALARHLDDIGVQIVVLRGLELGAEVVRAHQGVQLGLAHGVGGEQRHQPVIRPVVLDLLVLQHRQGVLLAEALLQGLVGQPAAEALVQRIQRQLVQAFQRLVFHLGVHGEYRALHRVAVLVPLFQLQAPVLVHVHALDLQPGALGVVLEAEAGGLRAIVAIALVVRVAGQLHQVVPVSVVHGPHGVLQVRAVFIHPGRRVVEGERRFGRRSTRVHRDRRRDIAALRALDGLDDLLLSQASGQAGNGGALVHDVAEGGVLLGDVFLAPGVDQALGELRQFGDPQADHQRRGLQVVHAPPEAIVIAEAVPGHRAGLNAFVLLVGPGVEAEPQRALVLHQVIRHFFSRVVEHQADGPDALQLLLGEHAAGVRRPVVRRRSLPVILAELGLAAVLHAVLVRGNDGLRPVLGLDHQPEVRLLRQQHPEGAVSGVVRLEGGVVAGHGQVVDQHDAVHGRRVFIDDAQPVGHHPGLVPDGDGVVGGVGVGGVGGRQLLLDVLDGTGRAAEAGRDRRAAAHAVCHGVAVGRPVIHLGAHVGQLLPGPLQGREVGAVDVDMVLVAAPQVLGAHGQLHHAAGRQAHRLVGKANAEHLVAVPVHVQLHQGLAAGPLPRQLQLHRRIADGIGHGIGRSEGHGGQHSDLRTVFFHVAMDGEQLLHVFDAAQLLGVAGVEGQAEIDLPGKVEGVGQHVGHGIVADGAVAVVPQADAPQQLVEHAHGAGIVHHRHLAVVLDIALPQGLVQAGADIAAG